MEVPVPAGKWLCTSCGEKTISAGGKVTIRFWEHPDNEDGFYGEVDGGEDTKEGRVVRDMLRLGSENTRGEGAYIAEFVPNWSDDQVSTGWSAS